jgi:hypothetical protein
MKCCYCGKEDDGKSCPTNPFSDFHVFPEPPVSVVPGPVSTGQQRCCYCKAPYDDLGSCPNNPFSTNHVY